MDKEALRRQIHAELQSEFDAKLRETKKQKSRLEEELESESEKWRSERRRLNQEIDRLESSLAVARDTRRKTVKPEPTARASDTQELSKLQAAADERLKRAQKEWDGEREKLEAEVARLQQGVAELLERANNPLRSNQLKKSQLETRLEDATRIKQQSEDAFATAKAEWERERLKLGAEMVKLRRLVGSPPKEQAGATDDTRAKDLEKRLTEAEHQNAVLITELESARKHATPPKQVQVSDDSKAIKERDDAREQVKRLARQLEEAQAASVEAARTFQKELEAMAASAQPSASEGQAAAEREVASVKSELGKARAELSAARERAEHQEQHIKKAEAAGRESEAKLQAALREKERLVSDLEKVQRELEAQKKTAKAAPEAAPANGANGAAKPSGVGIPLETAEGEVQRIEGKIVEIGKLIDHPDTELATVIKKNVERAELDAYLKGILFSLGRISRI
jgi:hypothetical protein